MLSAGLCRSLLNYHLMLCSCASDLYVNTFPCFYLISVFVAQQLLDSRDSYCESRVALYTCLPVVEVFHGLELTSGMLISSESVLKC